MKKIPIFIIILFIILLHSYGSGKKEQEGNEEPLEEFIKLIDESEKAFEIAFNINYRPANDNEKLFKVKGHYFVGKHKVTQISDNNDVKAP